MSIAEKLTTIAENTPKIYEAGKQAEYNEFWDKIQQNGKRTNYNGGFGGWNESSFIPKYDITPTNAVYMFTEYQDNTDMVEHLKKCGVTLDFSKCVNFTNFLLWSKIKRMGIINSTGATSITFYTAYLLETIDLLILKEDGTQSLNFDNCDKLKNITIEGVVGKNLNMGKCPLSKDSIINVVNALSSTTSNLTATFKETAISNAFGTINNKEWLTLIASKPNWTIALV